MAVFERPRLGNLYGALAGHARVAHREDPQSRKLPFVEMVWMPAYAVQLQTSMGQTESLVWTTVDAWSGEVSLFDGYEDLEPCEWANNFFGPSLSEQQAAEFARAGLLRFVLRQRGQIHKPTIEGVEKIVLYQYPFWVYYFRGRKKTINIRILDAHSGKTAGAKARANVLNAMVASRRGSACDTKPEL